MSSKDKKRRPQQNYIYFDVHTFSTQDSRYETEDDGGVGFYRAFQAAEFEFKLPHKKSELKKVVSNKHFQEDVLKLINNYLSQKNKMP